MVIDAPKPGTREQKPVSKEEVKEVLAFERGKEETPYLKGKFVITTLEEAAPAQDDTTYTITLDNDGEPDVYPGKETASAAS